MANKDRYSHLILRGKSLSIYHFLTKCIWLIMTGFSCRCRILDHCGHLLQRRHFVFLSTLSPVFSLVSDRLGGQVSAQKDAGTLDKVKKLISFLLEIADMAFCIVADFML